MIDYTCRMRIGQDSVTWYNEKGDVTIHINSSNKVTTYPENISKKEWVGMTEEDFVCVHQLCDTPFQAAEYTEHLLKEKNK